MNRFPKIIILLFALFSILLSANADENKEQPMKVMFDFSNPDFRENIGERVADTKGNIIDEIFYAGNVSLQITAGSSPAKLYVDTNRGQNLAIYKEYSTMVFKAPAGYALIEISFTPAGTSNMDDFSATSGTINNITWTGNAEGVRFLQGATSNFSNAIVTLSKRSESTVSLAPIEYTDCADIASFNALPAGTYAKVKLTDTEVIGISADGYSTVWIQDSTGGCWMQYTSQNACVKEKIKLNGYIYTVARSVSGNMHMKETEDTPQSQFSIDAIDDFSIIEGTLAEVNIASNKNKIVKINGASFVATNGTTGTLTQGDASITVSNGSATANQQLHKIIDTWEKDVTKMENVTIIAILVGKNSSENQLLPISIQSGNSGITEICSLGADKKIYNLNGVQINSIQKGIIIVNRHKVFAK